MSAKFLPTALIVFSVPGACVIYTLAPMISLGATFIAVNCAIFAIYDLIAATTRDRVLYSPRVMIWISRSIEALGLRLALERA